MQSIAQNTLRIFFLALYIPLSGMVGFLHTDDVVACGSGHLIIGNQIAPNPARSVDNGVCLACLFTAGHIASYEPFIPVLSPDWAVVLAPTIIAPESPAQPHSARAPPDLSYL